MARQSLAELAVIIPTLNAGRHLRRTLAALGPAGDFASVTVVDGGSADGSRAIAQTLGAQAITAARGRGSQLAAGAARAAAPWMLFLHADTLLEDGWRHVAAEFIGDPANRGKAAVFRFALDSKGRRPRRIERFVAWRSRRLGLPYGDQGLLIHRSLYDAVGGFKPVPLLEDVGIVRKIGRKRLAHLEAAAVTSAERFERDGYFLRSVRNYLVLGLYFVGVPPAALKRIYG